MKDYTKWNWTAISELMKGSLLNPKRFDELVRNTRFAARMIQFLKPSSKQFSDLPNDGEVLYLVLQMRFVNLVLHCINCRTDQELYLLAETLYAVSPALRLATDS